MIELGVYKACPPAALLIDVSPSCPDLPHTGQGPSSPVVACWERKRCDREVMLGEQRTPHCVEDEDPIRRMIKA